MVYGDPSLSLVVIITIHTEQNYFCLTKCSSLRWPLPVGWKMF